MFEFLLLNKKKKNKIIFSSARDIEPHEVLLDSLAEQKEKEAGFAGHKFEVPLLKNIIRALFIVCLLLIFFLFAKTFQLQIMEGDAFVRLAEKNKYIFHQIQAERGVIYDSNMEQLVYNKSNFDLVCPDEKIENLSHQELILFETKLDDLPDCQIVVHSAREYKDGDIFSHLIGYTGKIRQEEYEKEPRLYSIHDYVGRSGAEGFYEEYLRKTPGQLKIERDASGNPLSEEIIDLPQSGHSLVLWLDAALQRKVREALENKYNEIGAKGGVVVAMDPRNGGILSMVSLPSFDNNLFQKGADPQALQSLLHNESQNNPLFNRAISGRYVTGSTIKPLIALAALEEKIINPEKQIYGSAYIEIPHRYDPEITYRFRDWTTHGWVDMKKAIAQSCNIYFYTIGGGYEGQKGLGPTKIKEYLEVFNWNKKTGIDLIGENSGFVPDIDWKRETLGEGWWDGDTYNLSIGQGYLLITPLEIVSSFAAIANGGTLYRPRIAKEIIRLKEIEPEIIRHDFIDKDNLEIVRQGMRQAVSGENSPQASAVILNSLPVTSAAKTGTAELGNERYHNWVTVFAPYENPEIVLTIMLEDVKGIQAAVLPVAYEILDWYFSEGEENNFDLNDNLD